MVLLKLFLQNLIRKVLVVKIRSNRIAQQYQAVPIQSISVDIRTIEKKQSSPVIKRTHFPLMFSWACAIHKVQGLSLNKIVISCDLLKQKSFNPGQIYVAVSRVTSLEGLFLIGEFNSSSIIADNRVKIEYNYSREHHCVVFEEEQLMHDCNGSNYLKFTLCNVRSLRKHIKDIRTEQRFISSDLNLCTEPQLLNEDYNEDLYIENSSFLCKL